MGVPGADEVERHAAAMDGIAKAADEAVWLLSEAGYSDGDAVMDDLTWAVEAAIREAGWLRETWEETDGEKEQA